MTNQLRSELSTKASMPLAGAPRPYLLELFREGPSIEARSAHICFVGRALLPGVRWMELDHVATVEPEESLLPCLAADALRRAQVLAGCE